MRTRVWVAKIAVAAVAAVPLMTGVAYADSKSVSDFVHETMADQEQRSGCAWGRAVSGAGGDNRQGSTLHLPNPCK
jgi:hypothetical protein